MLKIIEGCAEGWTSRTVQVCTFKINSLLCKNI